MANLTFPSNPTNGQKVTVNDKVFVYNSTTSRWTATRLQVLGNLTGDFTIPTPVVTLSANGQTLNSLSNNYITYSVDQDAKITIENQTTNATAVLYLSNNTIKIDPSLNELTNGVIKINASNGRTIGTANYVFSIDNQAPFISLANSFYDVTVGTASFDVVVTGTDPENQPLTYSANVTGGNISAIESITQSANVFTITVASSSADAGNAVVTFTVDDGVETKSANVNFYVSPIIVDWTSVTTQATFTGVVNDGLFGIDVAIDGDTAVVGAGTTGEIGEGAVYIYTRSGSTWTQQDKITNTSAGGPNGTQFGNSVDISGDTVVIGAPGLATTFVYTRSGSTWSLQQSITHPDPPGTWGGGVIDGDTLLCTSTSRIEGEGGSNWGAAYVFTRSGSTWTLQQKLLPPTPISGGYFGVAPSISGDTVLIGEFGYSSFTGRAHIFTRSGSTWSHQQEIYGSPQSSGSRFGNGSALDGDTAVVGAYYETTGGQTQTGAVYIYTRSGSTWTQQRRIPHTEILSKGFSYFGQSISLEGDVVAIGAPFRSTEPWPQTGKVYIFERTGSVWSIQKTVGTPSSGYDGQSGQFGASVGLSSDTLIVGARTEVNVTNRGRSHIFVGAT